MDEQPWSKTEEKAQAEATAYVVLGKLDLDGLGVSAGRTLLVQQALGVSQPGQQLV